MTKNKTKLFLAVLTVLLAFALAIACTPQRRPAPNNNPGAGETRMENRDEQNNNGNERNRIDRSESQKKAKQLAEEITDQVKGINAATVIFAEEIAYVGIDLYANYDGDQAEKIKKEVAQVVKEEDPDIETVYVTEDADTFTRMKEIARDLENGKPLTGFLDELQNMFRRITPSMG